MSELPDKFSVTEVEETEEPIEEATEEESTVFSAPVTHKKTASEKKKRLLPIVLAAVLALAVLVGGTFAVIKLIPEKEEEEENTAPEIETVTVLDENKDELKTVTLTNENGVFTLYAETEESGDSSESTKTVKWYLKDYAQEAVNTYTLSGIVEHVAQVKALRKVEKTPAECGLDSPAVSAAVVRNDGTGYSLLIGGDSPDNSGVYLQVAGTDTIYLSDSVNKEDLIFDALSLANTDAIPAMDLTGVSSDYQSDEGKLSSFDKLTLSGASFPETLVLEPNNDSELSEYAAFITTAPTRRIADKVDEILALFSDGVSVSGAYSYDTSVSERKRLGLESPDLKAEIRLGQKAFAYSFKEQPDGGYAVWYDGANLIRKVDAGSIPFIEYRLRDYYGEWVYLQSINDLSGFTIQNKEKRYHFAISYDESEDAEEPYVITYEGKELTAQNFQDFYQICISLSCADYTVETATGDPDLTIIYTYSDSSRTPTKVDFRKVSETKYQYSIDGTPMGKVTATSISSLMGYAEKVAAGKSIK